MSYTFQRKYIRLGLGSNGSRYRPVIFDRQGRRGGFRLLWHATCMVDMAAGYRAFPPCGYDTVTLGAPIRAPSFMSVNDSLAGQCNCCSSCANRQRDLDC